jgi:hypothetical protein
MAVSCQNLTIGALSSSNALSVLVGALFKKFGLFLNTVVYVTANPNHHKDSKVVQYGNYVVHRVGFIVISSSESSGDNVQQN